MELTEQQRTKRSWPLLYDKGVGEYPETLLLWAHSGMRLLIRALACLLFAGVGASAFVLYGPHARIAARVEDAEPARFGLVLGTGRIRGNGEISPVFQARMEAAAGLFKAGKVEFLILSGYRVEHGRSSGNYDEPEDMRGALVTLGVPPERLYLDNGSHRTLDSILRAHCISREDQLIVVSQIAHVARALFLAWANGIKAVGVAAAEPSPEIAAANRIHEFFARLRAIFDVVTHRGASCDDLLRLRLGA